MEHTFALACVHIMILCSLMLANITNLCCIICLRYPYEVERLRYQFMSKSISVSYSNTGPLHLRRGFGTLLIDEAGIKYLDTRNNVAHVGHCHPEIVSAITYQTQMLQTNTRYVHPHSALLASKLVELMPRNSELKVVFFVNSGSEANDLALRLARAHVQQRRKLSTTGSADGNRNEFVITVDHAYHGHTMSTLDVSPYKHRQGTEIENCPNHVRMVPCPDVYRGEHATRHRMKRQRQQWHRESDMEAAKQYASYVERECESIKSDGDVVSAFLMEGGMSVAGVILPPQTYLRRCIDAVHKSGGVYIADEVQTGFGRLGKCMWAFQYSNDDNNNPDCDNLDDDTEMNDIMPDIVTVGKPFGNGMPLAAVITTPTIANAFESFGVEYFNTFAGSPVCCAAGLAMLHVLTSERLQENALHVGNFLLNSFRELQLRCEYIGDVRGSGLFIGVELVRDRVTLEPATEETSFICSMLKEKFKILTSVDGAHDNVIVIKPPMVFSIEDATLFLSCFEKALVNELPTAKDDLGNLGRTPT
jgi:ethanolamine-phosphate phospho-lyase